MVHSLNSGRKLHHIVRQWSTLLSLSLFLLLAARAAFGDDVESASNAVRLQLRWHHQFQFAGYYAAIEKGYYRAAGLEVTLVEGGKEKDTINEVVNGNAQYGVTNSELLLQRLNGKPLVVLAAIFQHSPLVFIARKDTGITFPQDLSGKVVKMSRTSRDIELQAMLQGEGIGFDKVVLLEDIASNEDYFDPKIDALAAYITNQPYFLKEKNIPYNIIFPSSYGIDFYGDCLFTSEEEVKNNPERVRAIRDATLEGWKYALANQTEIINLIKEKYKSDKSVGHLRYEAEEITKLIMPDLVEIGHINPGRWEHIAKVFRQFNLVPDGYSLDDFIFSPEEEKLPQWLVKVLVPLAVVSILITIGAVVLFLFNHRLQKEVAVRRRAEHALQQSESTLLTYSRQLEQFSLSAASMLSIRDEKVLFDEMSKAIVDLSDYKRVLILLFKDEPPYRELIGSAGISPEIIAKVQEITLSKRSYDNIFRHGSRLGKFSYYVPHTMKHILNQEAVFYGEGPPPDDDNHWHPADNLFVRMQNEQGELTGIISVDNSKSGAKPTDEIVRPLEIYASLLSQIIILKREHARRQQLEQKVRFSQKLEALGNLTGGIAHDFNNILGIIIGNTELAMLDTPESYVTFHNLSEIKIACHRARDIVQHLLMFSRKSDKELRPVFAADMLRDALRFLRTAVPPNIELVNRIETMDERILADPPRIYQALLNLFTNAIQAMEDSNGRLTFAAATEIRALPLKSTTRDMPPGRYVRLQITDTGHGIAPHLQEKIFDPYYTTREFGKGTGMGLSIVHGIIQSHNGVISVQSNPDKGTTFTIYLPVIAREEREHAATGPVLPGGKETILLVDDDEPLLEVGRMMLHKLGYSVVAKSSPEAALDIFRLNPERFQLLVTDMTMPGLSGSMLAEKVLEIRPDLPVFLCTGYSDKIDEQQATRIGITRYFEKPLEPVMFTAAIRQVLDGQPHA